MAHTMKKAFYWIYEKCAFIKILLIFFILLCPLILKTIKIIFSRRHVEKKSKNVTVGFFHPNCNACTPEENVLWSAVKAIQMQYDNVQICIYTGDLHVSSKDILNNVESKFFIKLHPNIRFIHLRQRKWIKNFAYMGSIWVGCEALGRLKPHIMIDTMGYGFVNFIFKYIGRCKVVSYIHNPLVSMEKLKTRHVVLLDNQYVMTRRSPNALGISKGIAFLYGWTGKSADVVMVNSLWTEENINSIWNCPQRTHIIYPPIGLDKLMEQADTCWDKKNEFQILNATEFEPENNHELIIQALSKIRSKIQPNIMNKIRLILMNLSVEYDHSYVEKLKHLVKKLNLEENVKLHSQYVHRNHLEEECIKSTIGIYAKADDNFNSDILAGLATGQIMIAHKSGASKNELIDTEKDSRNGYLAKSIEEYSEALIEIFNLSSSQKRKIQKAARRTAEQYTQAYFQKKFLNTLETFFKSKTK